MILMNYSEIKLPCVIKKVIDWDTVIVDIDHLLNIYTLNARIRLSGINAPSNRTVEGKASTAALYAKLLWQEDIMISFIKIKSRLGAKETKRDKFGRYLATIYVQGENINEQMVNEGFASIKLK